MKVIYKRLTYICYLAHRLKQVVEKDCLFLKCTEPLFPNKMDYGKMLSELITLLKEDC